MRVLLIALSISVFAVVDAAERKLHTERSLYRNISVIQDHYLRCMVFETRKENPPYQTCVDQRNKKKLVFNYTKLTLSGLLAQPNASNILVLGLGGGTLPMTLSQLLPNATITSVEIDPVVVKLAKEYFDYVESDKIITKTQDARLFVKRAVIKQQTFDWIILDAFNGDYIPEHLMTEEFLQEVKSILSENGVVTANTFSTSKLYDHESTTYQKVFGDFYNVKRRGSGNRIILASNSSRLLSMERIEASAEKLNTLLKSYDVNTSWLLNRFSQRIDWDINARTLTDQYSPANLLKYK
ncbi:MAG: fused MFS/spermidine synthase [Kangiellaceae bacterium]|jgi:spermidine synthase|nr:fused MFS/spermidine synthase [Kangiellaceae bacterium]